MIKQLSNLQLEVVFKCLRIDLGPRKKRKKRPKRQQQRPGPNHDLARAKEGERARAKEEVKEKDIVGKVLKNHLLKLKYQSLRSPLLRRQMFMLMSVNRQLHIVIHGEQGW